MGLEVLLDRFGQATVLAVGGLVIGGLFGFFAQRSRFCLRSAVIEFARGMPGGKLSVWLLSFALALLLTQGLLVAGVMDVSEARQVAARGSLSGAVIGGLLFGVGMILSRGCSSRLLVLAAQGNLPSILTGLVFAVTAQATITGVLAPWREKISAWWTIDGGAARDLTVLTGMGRPGALIFAGVWLLAAMYWCHRQRVAPWGWVGAVMVGLLVAGSWWFTATVAATSLEAGVATVQALSFTAPSAEVLTRVLFAPDKPLTFDVGLAPGVFLGSFLAAALFRELRLEGFTGGASMTRYMVGAVLMGFGGVMAGGCAVGAGLSGAAVFTLTAWVTLGAIWLGAALTDRLLDHEGREAAQPHLGDQPVPSSSTAA